MQLAVPGVHNAINATGAVAVLLALGMESRAAVDRITEAAVAAGEHAEVTGDVEALTEHPATPLREVLAAGR